MRRTMEWLLAAALLCSAAACYTPPRQLEQGKTGFPPPDKRYGVHWEKVQVGNGPVGYIQHEVRQGVLEDDRPVTTYWVTNRNFDRIGFYTELGYTYRFRTDGSLEFLGVCAPSEAVQVLLGGSDEVQFLPMDPPLSG